MYSFFYFYFYFHFCYYIFSYFFIFWNKVSCWLLFPFFVCVLFVFCYNCYYACCLFFVLKIRCYVFCVGSNFIVFHMR